MFDLMSNWLFSFCLQETPPPFKVPLNPVDNLSQYGSCLALNSYTGKENRTFSVLLKRIWIPGALENRCPEKEGFPLGLKRSLPWYFHLYFLGPKNNLKRRHRLSRTWKTPSSPPSPPPPFFFFPSFFLSFLEEKETQGGELLFSFCSSSIG